MRTIMQFTTDNMPAARNSLAASILRLSPEIQAWPKHVLTKGTNKEIVKLANLLCRDKVEN